MAKAPYATCRPVECRDLFKSYTLPHGRHAVVLTGVTMSLDWGSCTAIMGPSGSGKSTLLQCLAGLEAPTSGAVSVCGQNLSGLTPRKLALIRRANMGFVFQSYNLIPTMTVAQNVALPFRLRKMPVPWKKIAANLDRLGIRDLANMRPPSLSGGEQQRAALARVLASDPAVVFADEPTGALDQEAGHQAMRMLLEFSARPGHCAVIVTHDPNVASRCQRIMNLVDGELVPGVVGFPQGQLGNSGAAR